MKPVAISIDHFVNQPSPERARALFKSSVTQVEIETFTYCNRRCRFCANSYIDRRSENRHMDEALYLRILRDLAAVDYDQAITFSRYNEPLADRVILDHIREARRLLPKACLSAHSNGDYLDAAYLESLRAAGLNRLRVQVYLGNEERFDDDRILRQMARRLKKLGLPYNMTAAFKGTRYMAQLVCEGMEVTLDARNFGVLGVDRGQTVLMPQSFERRSPCLVVFQHLCIDCDGTVVPCCNIRSDEPRHAPYVIDRLARRRSLFEAFADSPLVEWRRGLLTFGLKRQPCNSCSYECLSESGPLRERLDTMAREFGLDGAVRDGGAALIPAPAGLATGAAGLPPRLPS